MSSCCSSNTHTQPHAHTDKHTRTHLQTNACPWICKWVSLTFKDRGKPGDFILHGTATGYITLTHTHTHILTYTAQVLTICVAVNKSGPDSSFLSQKVLRQMLYFVFYKLTFCFMTISLSRNIKEQSGCDPGSRVILQNSTKKEFTDRNTNEDQRAECNMEERERNTGE